ncbi:MAG: protein kinase [Planctomycetes bacterium]|nr:protein kinase [Planctomycetota bacterium]
MTSSQTDEPAFADLLDELLAELLNGDEPDLAAAAARHPQAAHRIDEAYRLANSVAGRRVSTRPVLRGYEIVRELGRGGMGTVYLARQADLDREVAIKVLPHSFGLSAHSRQRFLEEAKALARVEHDNIVGIHRIVDDGDLLAFEMEFVDGPSLQEVLAHLREVRAGGVAPTLQHVADLLGLPLAELGAPNLTMFFVRLGRAIGRALGAVHRAGFVHRDVKPANILLRQNGQPVLADFGLVRDTQLELSHKTGFVGTPVYSSPEQLRGTAPIGAATDVYALGVTLYECLTLAPPFAGRTTTDLLSRIESGRIPPLRRNQPEAPRDLETILAHAMELEPPRRYRDGNAFADDLQRLLDLLPIQARPASLLRRATKFARRNRLPLAAGCLGAALVAAAMFPVIDYVQAADRNKQIAQQEVRAARQELLSREVRRAVWQRSLWGGASGGAGDQDRTAEAALQRCVEHCDKALAAAPDDGDARRDRAVVRMALWLRQVTIDNSDSLAAAQAAPEYRARAAALPPLTQRFAAASVSGEADQLDIEAELRRAPADDRSSFGLLAFLTGDLRWCEVAWEERGDAPGAQDPLRDAVLGLIYLTDGAPERAFVRLRSAQRALPEVGLGLEIADAALAMGETELAQRWLDRTEAADDVGDVRKRLQADLRLAAGDTEAASRVYEGLARASIVDPTPHYRLAQLQMRAGDLEAAGRQLDELLLWWPAMTRLRLDRARVALLRRDVPAYVTQVLSVLADDRPRLSAGSAADLLEILRIGGLDRLHGELRAKLNAPRSGRSFLGGEVPLTTILPERIVDELQHLLPALGAAARRAVHLLGKPMPLDPVSAGLLVLTPLAANRLPGIATCWSPAQNLAIEAWPLLVAKAYPVLHSILWSTVSAVMPTQWSMIDMRRVIPPADLAPELSFGTRLQRGADWTGDGMHELLISAPPRDPSLARGRVLVVDGRTLERLADLSDDSADNIYGYAIALAGDVDGDGDEDWLIGAPAGNRDARYAFVDVISGRDHRRLARVTDEASAFGVAVCGVGDWNADGCADFAVGIPPIVRNATAQGRVIVYSGRDRSVLRTFTNQVPGLWFGAELADLGDADGDGVHDLAVSGNFGAAPGRAVLYSGRTGEVLHTWSDDEPSSGFGVMLTAVGDFDGDGRGDLAVSAVRAEANGGTDRVLIYSGRTGALITALRGDRPGSLFGLGVTSYRVAGQRTPWLVIGAPRGGDSAGGTVVVFTGAGEMVSTLQGPAGMAGFGSAVVAGEDIDGDGRPELFVSSPGVPAKLAVSRIDSRQMRFGR